MTEHEPQTGPLYTDTIIRMKAAIPYSGLSFFPDFRAHTATSFPNESVQVYLLPHSFVQRPTSWARSNPSPHLRLFYL